MSCGSSPVGGPQSPPLDEPNDMTGSLLVVDDDAVVREALVEALADAGYEVRAAEDGVRALALLAERAPDVMLSDVRMPGMDGLILARAIKTDPRISHAHLIMMTSMDRRDDMENFRECGVGAYLSKPMKQKALLDALEEVLASQDGPRAILSGLVAMGSGVKHRGGTDRLHQLRILIAEDNIVNQKVALNLLERLGFLRPRGPRRGRLNSNTHKCVRGR